MKIFELFLSALKSVGDVLSKIFDRQKEIQKNKENACSKTSKKTFYILIVLMLLCNGCGYIYVVSTPMTFDPNDFRALNKGQTFVAPNDGVYFSNYAQEKWIKAKIAEYELRKRGFDKEDN